VWTRDNVYIQSRDSVSKQSLDSRDTLSRDFVSKCGLGLRIKLCLDAIL
jgi:hypothetical protein